MLSISLKALKYSHPLVVIGFYIQLYACYLVALFAELFRLGEGVSVYNHLQDLIALLLRVAKKDGDYGDFTITTKHIEIPNHKVGENEPKTVRIRVRVYSPKSEETTPGVLYAHGGGFIVGSTYTHCRVAWRLCKYARVCVVSVDYRQMPSAHFPVPQLDCYEALKWMINSADELNVDTSRVGIAGDSAGAMIATGLTHMVSMDRANRIFPHPIKALSLVYPMVDTDFDTESMQKYADHPMLLKEETVDFMHQFVDGNEESMASPLLFPGNIRDMAVLPPTHFVTCEEDILTTSAVKFMKKMKKDGVSVEYKHVENSFHGFITFADGPLAVPEAERVIVEMAQFLRKNL